MCRVKIVLEIMYRCKISTYLRTATMIFVVPSGQTHIKIAKNGEVYGMNIYLDDVYIVCPEHHDKGVYQTPHLISTIKLATSNEISKWNTPWIRMDDGDGWGNCEDFIINLNMTKIKKNDNNHIANNDDFDDDRDKERYDEESDDEESDILLRNLYDSISYDFTTQ